MSLWKLEFCTEAWISWLHKNNTTKYGFVPSWRSIYGSFVQKVINHVTPIAWFQCWQNTTNTTFFSLLWWCSNQQVVSRIQKNSYPWKCISCSMWSASDCGWERLVRGSVYLIYLDSRSDYWNIILFNDNLVLMMVCDGGPGTYKEVLCLHKFSVWTIQYH